MSTIQSNNERALLSLSEAAASLGITVRFLRTLVQQGELPTVVLGRRRLIRPVDLQAFVERRTEMRVDCE